jgi:predicted AlkP superfamily pyrophosphatase or phosphodiesterase
LRYEHQAVHYIRMRLPHRWLVSILLWSCAITGASASAYSGHPKLVVIIIIDQFRGDYLERYRDQFADGGFRLFLDHGAYFTDCYYDYANTRTAAGHATLLTGAYSNGHGIAANEWWDPQKKKMVTSVEDDTTKLVGIPGNGIGNSPHNLLADTLGDELKLATQGKARVFAVSLKDRSAVLPAGFSGDGAYWIDPGPGAWITSTYYRAELPKWVQDFNASKRVDKYWNREWKDADGKVLRSTAPRAGKNGNPAGFYEVIGSTPFADEYQLDFAKELVVYEKLGSGPATDLLIVSLSSNDILGHQVGPDSAEMKAMALALDRELGEFFAFLGHQVGLANLWIALSADHGVAPLPSVAAAMRIPGAGLGGEKLRGQINTALAAKLSAGHSTDFVKSLDYPLAWLNNDAFSSLKISEENAEHEVGEAMVQVGLRGYFTRSQLARGDVPSTEQGHQFLHSYSPEGGWYVMGVPAPYTVGSTNGTDHASPYRYDTHVPLALYGLPFQAGTYRTHTEPVDLATTLASLLGINQPTSAVGRVLTEALSATRQADTSGRPGKTSAPASPGNPLKSDGQSGVGAGAQ